MNGEFERALQRLKPLIDVKGGRFAAWQNCYCAFKFASESSPRDLLAMHLHSYLANWGMMRASGGLLWLDYTGHIGAIDILMKYKKKIAGSSPSEGR